MRAVATAVVAASQGGWFRDVIRRPRIRHQRGKLLQRANLVGNDPSHRVCGLARLLWQIEDAAAQLLPGLIQFTLNLARHVLHFGD